MRIQLLCGYYMRCLLLTRKCPSHFHPLWKATCGWGVVCAVLGCCAVRGGGGGKCQLLLRFCRRCHTAEAGKHLAAMLGKGSRSQLCPSFFWAGSPWKCYDSHPSWGQKEPVPQTSWLRERELFRGLSLSHLSPQELVSVSGGWNAADIVHVHTRKTSRFWLLKHSEQSCQQVRKCFWEVSPVLKKLVLVIAPDLVKRLHIFILVLLLFFNSRFIFCLWSFNSLTGYVRNNCIIFCINFERISNSTSLILSCQVGSPFIQFSFRSFPAPISDLH